MIIRDFEPKHTEEAVKIALGGKGTLLRGEDRW